jgi:hypothetical protein
VGANAWTRRIAGWHWAVVYECGVTALGMLVQCIIEFSTLAYLEISAHETLIVTVQRAKSAAL